MKSIKKVITDQIKMLYYREPMSWLRYLYRERMSVLRAPHLYLFGFMILFCLYIIKPFKFVKLILIQHERIGQVGPTDLFLRRLQLENTPKRGILYVGISGKVANQQLLTMFRRKLPIIQNTLLHEILNQSVLRRSRFYRATPSFLDKFYEFNNTEPNLYFTASEEEQGKKLLKRMGVADNSWFICFHSRDSVYLSNQGKQLYGSSKDWSSLNYRDCDIKNCLAAAEYVASSGGSAVRMGYGVAEKLPDLDNPRIIDYASYYRTDFGDAYLLAKCKFLLGAHCGLYVVALIFHVPAALTNYIHLAFAPLSKGDLYIPKKIWSIEKKRFLTLRELMESEVAHYVWGEQYAEAGLEVVENTADEILGLAEEMNDRLDGNFEYTEEDEELQKRFRSLIQPHHRGYGSPARIGAKFLRQNRELLK